MLGGYMRDKKLKPAAKELADASGLSLLKNALLQLKECEDSARETSEIIRIQNTIIIGQKEKVEKVNTSLKESDSILKQIGGFWYSLFAKKPSISDDSDYELLESKASPKG